MEKDRVIDTLRAHQSELKAAGILSLRIFGSVARGQASPGSDVDIAAAFDETMDLSLFDVAGLQNRLSDLLGVSVDLIEEGTAKALVRENLEREAVLAF